MPCRILLLSANRCSAPDPVFPLGLSHLSAALRRARHECVWLDSLADAPQFLEVLRANRPDYVGISLRNIDDVLIRKQETFFNELASLTEVVRRELDCPVFLGGSGFSIFPGPLLEMAGADFGIAGEGERGLLELINALETGGDFRGIPGLVFREHGRVVLNPPAHTPLEWELTEADRPAPIVAHYLKTGSMLNLQTQRGCAFHCCYCTYPVIEGQQHRRRPPELVAEDFAQLQRLGAKYAFIVDSVFNSSPRHVTEVCEAILRRNLKLPWGCFLRPQGLNPEMMRLMGRAGLAHIEFGSDSFCDEVLAAYRKDFTFEQVLHASEMAGREKIDFCHFLIAGGPGETRDTLERGYKNSLRLNGAVMMAVVGMRIYPGTHLFEQAVAEGRLRRDANLLSPAYYVSPSLTAEEIFELLKEFARRSPNWIVGDPDPAYEKLVARLRQRGVAGPLWSYFSMLQRLQPQALAGGAGSPA
jgi:radical SAM superfamily enzyme YgiQ (UPF0313 family)